MRRDTFDAERIRYWFTVDRIPLTKVLIVSNIVTFVLIALFFKSGQIELGLGFIPTQLLSKPWTLLTYPFVGACCNPIFLLFTAYWTWFVGGSLERSWGTPRFAWFFFSVTAISALSLLVGGKVTGVIVPLVGLGLPLAGLTIAFAMLNPEQQILFMLFIPLKLKYLAIIDVALVFISYGQHHLLLGFFALLGCAYSYWYIQPNRFTIGMPARRNNVTRVYEKRNLMSELNPFRKMKEERDRERLRKLFERSFDDDDDLGRR